MSTNPEIRWGILSTARIAGGSFLPALRASGSGRTVVVGSRDVQRAQSYADSEGIDRAVEGYDAVLADDSVDAVYIPLPNGLHAEWTIKAMEAGKAVLCEKPLCISEDETRKVLEVAQQTGALLWEAFVFPFRAYFKELTDLIARGDIGDVRGVQSLFHFQLDDRGDIRYDPSLAGGALNDAGCYPIHLATLLLGSPLQGAALAEWTTEGVDGQTHGVLEHADKRTSFFSCGMTDHSETFGRILGTEGEVRLSHPFHPSIRDTMEVRIGGDVRIEQPFEDEPSFTAAIRHIHAVLRNEEEPRHLAVEDAMPTAHAMQLARDASGA